MRKKQTKNVWRKTIKNKISALVLIAIGIVPVLIERDATMLLFALSVGIPLFFAKENWMMW